MLRIPEWPGILGEDFVNGTAYRILTIIFTIFIVASPATAEPTRRHFMIIYGYQNRINTPHGSHIFATFIEADGSPSTHNLPRVESRTLSWLPAQQNSRFLRLRPEPGLNFSLDETMGIALSRGLSVMRWGPVEITESLYVAALARIDFLESGLVDYIIEDKFHRNAVYTNAPGGAINCIHALSDLGGFIQTRFLRGFSAARRVYDHLQQSVVASQDDNEWVAAAIGVEDVPRATSN